jgi:hypothetical protein
MLNFGTAIHAAPLRQLNSSFTRRVDDGISLVNAQSVEFFDRQPREGTPLNHPPVHLGFLAF